MTDPILGIPGVVDLVEIGRGGFGVVYRGRETDLDRPVAVKMLPVSLDQRARDRFDRERRAMGVLSRHPNIVTVYRAGLTESGNPYLVMELLEGGAMDVRLRREGPVPWREALAVGVALCGAVETAHRAGVLHRDIKPGNVLISNLGDPKLADFGIARLAGAPETRSAAITASINHAAPEIIDGRRPSVRSDVYALSSTLFELIAGHAAFARPGDESMISVLARIARDPVPDLRDRSVPIVVCDALERGMAKDPDLRPASAEEFGQLLIAAQRATGETPTAMRIEGPPRPPAGVDDDLSGPTTGESTGGALVTPLTGPGAATTGSVAGPVAGSIPFAEAIDSPPPPPAAAVGPTSAPPRPASAMPKVPPPGPHPLTPPAASSSAPPAARAVPPLPARPAPTVPVATPAPPVAYPPASFPPATPPPASPPTPLAGAAGAGTGGRRGGGSRRGWWAAAAAVVLIGGGAGGFALTRGGDDGGTASGDPTPTPVVTDDPTAPPATTPPATTPPATTPPPTTPPPTTPPPTTPPPTTPPPTTPPPTTPPPTTPPPTCSIGDTISDTCGNGDEPVVAYDSFEAITDATGAISLMIPTEWADRDLGTGELPVTLFAAPDLEGAFSDPGEAPALSEPGVLVTVVAPGVYTDADAALDDSPEEGCEVSNREDFSLAVGDGRYELFGCEGTTTVIVHVYVVPPGGDYGVFVSIQAVEDRDINATGVILSSLTVDASVLPALA